MSHCWYAMLVQVYAIAQLIISNWKIVWLSRSHRNCAQHYCTTDITSMYITPLTEFVMFTLDFVRGLVSRMSIVSTKGLPHPPGSFSLVIPINYKSLSVVLQRKSVVLPHHQLPLQWRCAESNSKDLHRRHVYHTSHEYYSHDIECSIQLFVPLY